jgi:hypothetical protein
MSTRAFQAEAMVRGFRGAGGAREQRGCTLRAATVAVGEEEVASSAISLTRFLAGGCHAPRFRYRHRVLLNTDRVFGRHWRWASPRTPSPAQPHPRLLPENWQQEGRFLSLRWPGCRLQVAGGS